MEGKCGGKIVKMKRREGGVGGKLQVRAEKYQRWEKHKKTQTVGEGNFCFGVLFKQTHTNTYICTKRSQHLHTHTITHTAARE